MVPTQTTNVGQSSQKVGFVLILLSAAIGAFFAALSDIAQKDNASAIVNLSQAIQDIFLPGFSPIHMLGLVVLLSVALCFVFEPKTKPKAFYLGASVLALAMTLVPYKSPPELSQPVAAQASAGRLYLLSPVYASTQGAPSQQGAEVQVHLVTAGDLPIGETTVSLMNPGSRKILARSSVREKTLKFVCRPGRYLIRVESEGFQVVEDEIQVKRGENDLEIELKASALPVFLQRLFPVTKGGVAVQDRQLPPAATISISVDNTSRQVGPEEWEWTVFIEGSEDAIGQIDCVEYHLHPTFSQRVRRVCNRGEGHQAFPLTARGWGAFEIRIRVFLREGGVQELTHHLRL